MDRHEYVFISYLDIERKLNVDVSNQGYEQCIFSLQIKLFDFGRPQQLSTGNRKSLISLPCQLSKKI